ncbi:MAG: hypothetical protein WCE79_27125 [Xanthobacteraceae bacterium]
MVMIETVKGEPAAGPVPTPGGPLSYIHWGPGIAGAIVAAATSFVMMSFASAVGLMVASPSPTWRDASVWLAILSGFWIIVVAVGSFALGGYIAGRVRSTWNASPDEVEFRDGVHGLIAWALGVMLGAVLLALTATTFASGNAASPPRDTAGAPSFLAFELDRLFRPEAAGPELRGEAARIIMRGLGRTELPAEDRAQLVRITSSISGLAAPEAERRVGQVLTGARVAATQARRSAVILGFSLAAALLAGAAAAWMAAGLGGKHRDDEFAPPLRWGAAPF